MILARRTIPALSALLIVGAFELLVFMPELWHVCLGLIGVVLIGGSWLIQKDRTLKGFSGFTITPVLFSLGAFMVVFILESQALLHALIAMVGLATLLYMENVFLFHFLPDRYKPHALENVSFPLNILTLFLVGTGLSAVWTLRHIHPGILTTIFFVAAIMLAGQYFWISKVPLKKSRWGVLFSAVLAAQLFWILAYTPLSFFVSGMLLVGLFYLTLNFTRYSTLDSLAPNIVKRTIAMVAVVMISVLATAQWV